MTQRALNALIIPRVRMNDPHGKYPFELKTMSQSNRSQSIAVVTQVINEMEAQGLLMLFDPQEHVAKRLTGDLIAAGVLQEDRSVEKVLPTYPVPSDESSDS